MWFVEKVEEKGVYEREAVYSRIYYHFPISLYKETRVLAETVLQLKLGC